MEAIEIKMIDVKLAMLARRQKSRESGVKILSWTRHKRGRASADYYYCPKDGTIFSSSEQGHDTYLEHFIRKHGNDHKYKNAITETSIEHRKRIAETGN